MKKRICLDLFSADKKLTFLATTEKQYASQLPDLKKKFFKDPKRILASKSCCSLVVS